MNIDALTSKRAVLGGGLLGAALLLLSGAQSWVSGTVDDAVLGASFAHASGSQVAPAAVAAGLVAAAAVVVSATSGAVVRRVCALVLLLSALLSAQQVLSVASGPGAALGRSAGTALARRQALSAVGHVAPWLWVAALGSLLTALAGVAAMVGARRWSGLSSRYDAPSPDAALSTEPPSPSSMPNPAPMATQAGEALLSSEAAVAARQPRTPTPWERLSAGEDPTLGGPGSGA